MMAWIFVDPDSIELYIMDILMDMQKYVIFLYNETYDQIYQQVAMFFGKKWALNLEDHP